MLLLRFTLLLATLLLVNTLVLPGFEDDNWANAFRMADNLRSKIQNQTKHNFAGQKNFQSKASGWNLLDETILGYLGGCGFQIPGVALSVTSGSSVVYSKTFGFADVEKNKPLTSSDLFVLCSCSKPFTATAALSAKYKGDISSLDAKVRDLLKTPWHFDKDPVVSNRITLRDLLLHKTSFARSDTLYSTEAITTIEESVDALQHFETFNEFRNTFNYNNYAYTLAGVAAASAQGKSFAKHMQDSIFKPLKMKHATTSFEKAFNTHKLASLYTLDNDLQLYKYPSDNLRYVEAIAPAASVILDQKDFEEWLLVHSNGGKDKNGNEIFSADLLAESYKLELGRNSFILQASYAPYDFTIIGQSPAWTIGTYRGRKLLFFNGGEAGVYTITMILPDDGISVGILLNMEYAYTTFSGIGLGTLALDIALGITPVVNAGNVCDWPFSVIGTQARQKMNPITTEIPITPTVKRSSAQASCSPPLNDYVGKFNHPAFKTFTVQNSANSLTLTNALLTCTTSNQVVDTFTVFCRLATFKYALESFEGQLIFTRNELGVVDKMLFPYWLWDGGVPLPPAPFNKIN